ncbi:hypothetical protein U8527_01675 [Kordia algicida OT-1]|uniref:hypothetical protein n=1 Tax=Kordia algicida TaxID=221066 RepID=UPI003D9B827D
MHIDIVLFRCIKGTKFTRLKGEKSIFILYDATDNDVKKNLSSLANGKIKADTYYYTFLNQNKKDDCESEQFNFWITYKSYESFNDLAKNKKTSKFNVSKDFLEINKSKIINRAFMDSIGFKKTFNLLKDIEYIYLIDKQEVKNNVYTVKKVNLSFSREE